MELQRINNYEDPRFSPKALRQHGCFLVEGAPYEVEIISDSEAVIRSADRDAEQDADGYADQGVGKSIHRGAVQDIAQDVFADLIQEFRFYAPHIVRFYDIHGGIVGECPPVQLLTISLHQIQPSQFYVDEDKIAAVGSFIHQAEDIVIQVLPHEGRYISLDGHTRLYYAVMQGWDHVRAVVESSDDWVYGFVKEAQKRNVHTPHDMMLVDHSGYEKKWNRFCDEFFAEGLFL